jgi:syntaxin-binding protein 1
VLDEDSRRVVFNVLKDDDILKHRIISMASSSWCCNADKKGIDNIENRRDPNPELPAIYILSSQAYVVDCLMADLERQRYQCCHLLWTSSMFASTSNAMLTSSLAAKPSRTTGEIANSARHDSGI